MSHLKIPIIKKMDSPNQDNENENYTYFSPSKRSQNMNTNSASYRQMMHRPSVRSISELPNVIGAQKIENQNDICTYMLCALTWLTIILFFPFSAAFIFRIVQEYERAVIFRLGRLRKSSCGPGVILVIFNLHYLRNIKLKSKSNFQRLILIINNNKIKAIMRISTRKEVLSSI